MKEMNTQREGEIQDVKVNLKNLNENYKTIAEGQNDLKSRITRMINSLRAFYASMILNDENPPKPDNTYGKNRSLDFPKDKL